MISRPCDPLSFLIPPPPLPLIVASLIPIHLSITLTDIVFIIPLIDISRAPCIDTITMFLVFYVFSLVFIRVESILLPGSTAVPETVSEIAFVKTAVGPEVFTVTVRFSHVESALVEISIGKFLYTLAVFETFSELPLISVSIDPDMYPHSISFIEFPLPNIIVALGSAPHSRTVFEATYPLSFIKLSIWPLEMPQTLRFPIDIKSCKGTSILKGLMSPPVFEIALPLPLILTTIVVKHDSFAMPFSVDEFAVEGSCSVFLEFEITRRGKTLHVDYIGMGTIVFKLLQKGFVGEEGGASEDRFFEGRIFIADCFTALHQYNRYN
jgi:hypothetical protein